MANLLDLTPLSYDCLRSVVKHLDPNKRVQYSLLIPSIRAADKNLPLRIYKLSLGHRRFSINDVEYSLALVRMYPSNGGPPKIRELTSHDVDELGSVNSRTDPATPGDLVIEADVQKNEPTIADLEELILNEEATRAHRIELNREMGYMRLESEMTEEELRIERERFKHRRQRLEIASLDESIRKLRKEITFYQYRDEGIKPKIWMRATIKLPAGSEPRAYYEPVNYNKKLFEAEKYLANKFFGERAVPIVVNHLEFGGSIEILRLPPGLKLTVKNLDVANVRYLLNDAYFISMLTPEPLNMLRIKNNRNPPVTYELDLVKTAKKLHIVFDMFELNPQVLDNLENVEVHISNYIMGPEGFVELVRNWQNGRKEIGTIWTFKEFLFEWDLFYLLKELLGEAKVVGRSLIIPISPTSELLVSHFEDPESSDRFLRMEVLAVGEAVELVELRGEIRKKSDNKCCVLL